MSREIKFRAWDKQTKSYDSDREFVLSSTGELMELCSRHNGTWEYHYADTDRFVLEQYTGLKDKNGREIYEGDIVEIDWYIYGDKPAYRVESKVIFDEEGVRVCNGKHSDLLKYCTGIEVIGNIHENPELLEK